MRIRRKEELRSSCTKGAVTLLQLGMENNYDSSWKTQALELHCPRPMCLTSFAANVACPLPAKSYCI